MFVTFSVKADIFTTIIASCSFGNQNAARKSLQRIQVELNLTRGAKIWRVHEVRVFRMISRRIQQSFIMNVNRERLPG